MKKTASRKNFDTSCTAFWCCYYSIPIPLDGIYLV